MAKNVSEQDSTPKSARPSNAKGPREWPTFARTLADTLLDMFETLAENSMEVTSRSNEIDATVLNSIEKLQAGHSGEAIDELRKVLGITTVQRGKESHTLLSVAGASMRLTGALHGKYAKSNGDK